MSIYISIISHGHEDILSSTSLVKELSQVATVIIKNNKQSSKGTLNHLQINDNVIVLDSADFGLGFGHNNNYIFNYIKEYVGINNDDYFCVINPDIIVDKQTVVDMISKMKSNNYELCTLPLYLNREKTQLDESIRNFPGFYDFFKSFLYRKRDAVKFNEIGKGACSADWAAGSFLIFKASLYSKLNGFDQRYFMYCEDIDICFRANIIGVKLVCLKDYDAIHLAQRASRSIFTRNFLWHLKSIFIYLFLKNKKYN